MILSNPGAAVLAFFVFVAWWAIIVGIFQLMHAVLVSWHRLFWVMSGLLSLILGVLLLMSPFSGAVIATYFAAIEAIFLGSLAIYFAQEVRKLQTIDKDVLILET